MKSSYFVSFLLRSCIRVLSSVRRYSEFTELNMYQPCKATGGVVIGKLEITRVYTWYCPPLRTAFILTAWFPACAVDSSVIEPGYKLLEVVQLSGSPEVQFSKLPFVICCAYIRELNEATNKIIKTL